LKLAQARVHFIGIGGIGMCGLAELLYNMGAKVTGSDIAENANVVRLREMGLQISIGHEASNIGNAEVVVYSSAEDPTYSSR
jgi:UDP-N-acetylmuramate--alanine ligase